MWNNYFLQIRKKYSMRVSTKTPLVINLDGKNITKNKNINILEKYKGSFRDALEKTAIYFSKKYKCLSILGADEVSFIFENPMILIEDLNDDKDNFSTEIISLFSQYFFDYFNNIYNFERIYWHGKCYSIPNDKIISFIKYKSRLIQVLTTTYFLKFNGIKNAGIIGISEKLKKCDEFNEYIKFKPIEKGLLFLEGQNISIEDFINGNIVEIFSLPNDSIIEKNDTIIFNDSMLSNILLDK